MTQSLAVTGALMRRALNEVVRVPGAAVPGVIAPTIFLLGLTAAFGKLTEVRGFGGPDEYISFLAPVTLLQCAGFTGAATGVNLADPQKRVRTYEVDLADGQVYLTA